LGRLVNRSSPRLYVRTSSSRSLFNTAHRSTDLERQAHSAGKADSFGAAKSILPFLPKPLSCGAELPTARDWVCRQFRACP
jgi:hypothetical protein